MEPSLPAAAVVALAVGLAGYKTFAEHRGALRNRRNQCGRCGARLPYEEHYRVEGMIVCPSCARHARRVVVSSFGVLALTGAVVLLAMTASLLSGGRDGWPGVGMIALAAAGLIVTWRSFLGYMKQANARAIEEERRSALRPADEDPGTIPPPEP